MRDVHESARGPNPEGAVVEPHFCRPNGGMSRSTLRLRVALLAGLVAALACGPAVPDYTVLETPSGRAVKVEEVLEVPVEGGGSGLLLRYRTDFDLTDVAAVQNEVEDVWRGFRPAVESRGLGTAVILATQPLKTGWEQTSRAYQFVIARGPDGAWALRQDETRVYWQEAR